MKIEIKATSDGIGYASKTPYEYEGKSYDADITNGDIVTIKDEGAIESGGKFGDQHYFKIDTRNGIKKAAFNQSSLNVLAQTWGDESAVWMEKKATVLTQKAIIAGERRVKTYYVTEGWTIDEWGDLVKVIQIEPPAPTPVVTVETTDVPKQRNAPEQTEIRPEDIPF